MSKRQPIEVCVECHEPFLDLYAIEIGERGRRPRRCRGCKKKHDAAQRQAYRDARREYLNRKNREFNREYRTRPEVQQRAREYNASDGVRAAQAKRTAERKMQMYATRSEKIYRKRVFDRDGGRCHICSKLVDKNDWHLDHIVPLLRGGSHTYDNVAVAHPACNLAKGAGSANDQLRLIG